MEIIVGLTYLSGTLANRKQQREDYTYSSYQAISMEIQGELSQNAEYFAWVDGDIFLSGVTNAKAFQITQLVMEACDATVPRRWLRQPNCWWNNKIAKLQAACIQRRSEERSSIGLEKTHRRLRDRRFLVATVYSEDACSSRSRRDYIYRLCE